MGKKCIWASATGAGCPGGLGQTRRPLNRGVYRLRTLEYIIRRFNLVQEAIDSYSGLLRMATA